MRLRFRDCVLDTGVRSLTRKGKDVVLSPKAFNLLEILAAGRPNALSHADLRGRLRPETVAGGTTLARLVSEVRAAIGDGDRRPAEVSGCAIRWGRQLVPLASGENVIGRAIYGLITLPSTKVSRPHARIVVSGGRVILEDLGSRNGTYVGDRRIESAVELKNGDRIGICPALLIVCLAADEALTSMQSTPSR